MRKHRDAHAHAGIRAGSVVGSSGAPLFVCELEHGCPVAVRQHQFRSEAVLELGRCVEEGLGVAYRNEGGSAAAYWHVGANSGDLATRVHAVAGD
eukprot:scaffold176380_cov28-Tisochrysis_lutea.AAC.2